MMDDVSFDRTMESDQLFQQYSNLNRYRVANHVDNERGPNQNDGATSSQQNGHMNSQFAEEMNSRSDGHLNTRVDMDMNRRLNGEVPELVGIGGYGHVGSNRYDEFGHDGSNGYDDSDRSIIHISSRVYEQQDNLIDDSLHEFYQVANLEGLSQGRSTTNEFADGNIYTNDDIDGGLSKISPVSSKNMNTDKYSRRYKRIILWVSIISALLIIILQSFMFAVINIHKYNRNQYQKYIEISIFFALFIFAGIYQIFITIVGVFSNNLLILAGLCFFYACMLIYTGIQYDELINSSNLSINFSKNWETAIKATNIATIIIIGLTLLTQVYVVFFKLKNYIKWFRFKQIGADLHMRSMYSIFQIHRVCLIFDFFFFLGFTIQFIVIMINDKTSPEFIITVIILPLSILILFISDYSVTRELLWLSCLIVVLYCGGITYVLFKTIRLFTHYTSAYGLTIKPGDYFPGRKSLLSFAIFSLILLLCSIITEIMVMRQYNQGLKPIVSKYYQHWPGSKKTNVQVNLQHEKLKTESFIID